MNWNKRPMFRNAVNMHGGGMVPMPRMQQGGAPPMGIPSVSPDLFSPAEFMGEPLNEMTNTGTGISGAGFFPEGNFGSPAVTDTGIVAGLDEEMVAEPEVKENKLELAKQQAMSIFDQSFEETMAVMQAQMAAGGMPMQDMDMILMDEIEVLEGQAEATVKEAMGLPQDVDLIPAEVAQSYLEKARMIVSAPPAQEQPMEMPMGIETMAQEVQGMRRGSSSSGVQPEEEEEETDPLLSIIEENRKGSIERQEARREREIKATEAERDADEKKIRAGDFSEGFKTDWSKLEGLKEEVKAVASEEAMNKSYLSPALSTMGGKWLEATSIKPKRAKLAGRKAVLDYEIKIEELKQAEQQALKQGDAAMLRDVYKQTQKIKGELSDTLLSTTGAIEKQALSGTSDIIAKQIGDEEYPPTWRADQYWRDMLKDPSSDDIDKRIAEQALGIGSGKGDVATRTAEFVKLANAAWKDYASAGGGTMSYDRKVERFIKEFAPIIEFHWSTILPTDPNFSDVVRNYMMSQDSGAQATPSAPKTLDLGTMGIPMDQANTYIDGMINQGFLSIGDTVRLPNGKETIITQEMIDDLGV